MGWLEYDKRELCCFCKSKILPFLNFYSTVPFKTHSNLLSLAMTVLIFPFLSLWKSPNSNLNQSVDQDHPNLISLAITVLFFPFHAFPHEKNPNSNVNQSVDQCHNVPLSQKNQFLAGFLLLCDFIGWFFNGIQINGTLKTFKSMLSSTLDFSCTVTTLAFWSQYWLFTNVLIQIYSADWEGRLRKFATLLEIYERCDSFSNKTLFLIPLNLLDF